MAPVESHFFIFGKKEDVGRMVIYIIIGIIAMVAAFIGLMASKEYFDKTVKVLFGVYIAVLVVFVVTVIVGISISCAGGV